MPSYSRQAKVGFLVGMIGRGAMDLASIPTTIVLARLLSPHDFGIAAAAGFFVIVAQRLTNFGFNVGIVRLATLTEFHTSTVLAINLILGGSAWALLALLSPLLAAYFRSPESAAVIPVAALTFLIGALGSVPQALLTRELRFKQILTIETIASWTSAIMAMALAWYGMRYWALVYSQVFGASLSTALKFVASRWRPTLTFSSQALKDLWSFAFGVHVKRSLEAAASNLDNLVIARVLGISELGLYDKAFTTMNRALTWVSALGPSVSLSVLAKIQDEPGRFRAANRKVLLSTCLLAFPLFAALAVMARPLFLLMFGRQWMSAVVPFQILCVAGALKLLAMYLNSAMEAKGRVWGAALLQAIYVACIVLGVAAGSRWGLGGAAFAVAVATALMALLTCDLLRRITVLHLSDLLVPQIPGLACAVALAAVVRSVGFLVHTNFASAASVWLLLALQSGTAVLFYVGFLLLCPIASVRQLVDETLAELAPPAVNRWRRRLSTAKPQSEVIGT